MNYSKSVISVILLNIHPFEIISSGKLTWKSYINLDVNKSLKLRNGKQSFKIFTKWFIEKLNSLE